MKNEVHIQYTSIYISRGLSSGRASTINDTVHLMLPNFGTRK